MIEINLPAKGAPSELLKQTEKRLLALGVDPFWVDYMMLYANEQYLGGLNLQDARAHHILFDSFSWTDTPEGFSFWDRVCKKFSKNILNPDFEEVKNGIE